MDGETTPPSRWTDLRGPARAAAYDARWTEAPPADGGHGEADLVDVLLGRSPEGVRAARVLDAGCGTGRVAIELARRGLDTVGVDRDPDLLAAARAKAPDLEWVEADLVALGTVVAPSSVDVVVLAGNVLLFTDEGSEDRVVEAVATALRPGGLVVAGFQLRPGGWGVADLDAAASGAGLTLRDRWATWDRQPWSAASRYQVSVHRRGLVPDV
jgi:SAM-dependent methyltransferase